VTGWGYDPDEVEMLRSYECPECGPFFNDDGPTVTPAEMASILGGDHLGFMRCPDCGCEVEQTLDSMLDSLRLIAERMPELRPVIAVQVGDLL
jgi:hypothetical protein